MIYLDILQLYLLPQLEDQQPNVVFQQEVARPRWTQTVMDQFRGLHANLILRRLISSRGGYVKEIVYKNPGTSLDELKLRTVATIEKVTLKTPENTRRDTECRVVILRAKKDAHTSIDSISVKFLNHTFKFGKESYFDLVFFFPPGLKKNYRSQKPRHCIEKKITL